MLNGGILRRDRHGFRPGLSILDLLMNTGREGIFTLMHMAQG